MQAKKICFFCFRKVWQIFAVALVVMAVLVSLLKYTLPYANDYKHDIETLINKQFGVDLAIGAISASWQGTGPALVLENLTFEDNQNAPIALSIAKTSLQLNVVESLKNWQLRSDYFVLNGFVADVNLQELNKLKSNDDSEFEQQSLIESLFLGETGHFSIQKSQLNLVTDLGRRHTLLLEDITWQNSPTAHQGVGEVSIPGFSQGHYSARLSFTGERLRELSGQVYLRASKVDVTDWLTQYLNKAKVGIHTELNGELWLSMKEGELDDVHVNWLPSYIKWLDNGQSERIELASGQVLLAPSKQALAWELNTTPLQLLYNDEPYLKTQIQGEFNAKQQQVWFTNVSLELLSDLGALTNFDFTERIARHKPHGMVEGRFESNTEQNFALWLGGRDIAWRQVGGIPGADNIRLELTVNQDKGAVSIFSENAQFQTSGLFDKSLSYNQLNLELQFFKDNNNWHVLSDSLWFDNDDLTIAGEMHLNLTEQPELDLYVEVLGGSAEVAGHYFPQTLMKQSLIKYLNDAILGGFHRESQVLFSGRLTDFPFSNGQGQFDVVSKIDNAEFAFAPQWPAIKNADVTLHFANERMDIYAHTGQLINQQIDNSVVVSIANLDEANELVVDINHTTAAQTLQTFFTATPLKDPLVEVLNIVQGHGGVTGNIGLKIDLHDLNVLASGEVTLRDLPIYLSKPGLQLEHVNTVLKFSDDVISISDATATWLGMPLEFSVSGDGNETKYQVDISTSLLAQSDKLLPYSEGLLDGYLLGETDLMTDISLVFNEQSFNYTAVFSSDLVGMTSNFPLPYRKEIDSVTPLKGIVQGDDISNLITANIDNSLFFNAILDNETGALSNAHIISGAHDKGLAQQDFRVSITQPELLLKPWIPFIDRLIDLRDKPASQTPLLPPLSAIRAEIGKVDMEGVSFNDFEMRLEPSIDGMTMRLNAKELRAQVLLPSGGSSRPITIDTDYLRLNLPKNKQTEDQTEILLSNPPEDLSWLARLPAIAFNCSDCRIDNYQLDAVSISLFGDGNKLVVPELVIDKGDHVLRGQGQWFDGITRVDGIMNSKDIGELFDEFDLTSTIKDSKANIGYQLHWSGAPFDLHTASLGGEINWELGDGHLTEVSDQGARVFSLLSLDSLVRKLKLDFRDVFSKGFFYNKMQGTVQLEQGIAYTKDTRMDGVPADLSIQGYANLNTQEINYDLAVAPQVTSSLPVIVAWMVNPVTGLAALALDKVIHSARVISEIKFKVTGTMDEPVVTEINRKSREVELPQAAQNTPPQSSQSDAAVLQRKEVDKVLYINRSEKGV
ncbi:TIGR02099 family protein [Pseudoalteromonas sp. MMG013]|uniref:YhdP family protein n=1 Tax=Pseudoalteromonas sp. MMG013 TaxID=2822687 RepID=UPI001B397C39|nr:YhdP family protein [Pseudoalteromonas sp. MMG013]MBQ4861407.1 TIGR02099 family protein [Pseudoalteromonas sp. MMG013]